MKHLLSTLLLTLISWTAGAIDQQWHYNAYTDAYYKITAKTGNWNEANSEAKSWHAGLYQYDDGGAIGSWLKIPGNNGLNWVFWADALYGLNSKGKLVALKAGNIGVSKTGVITSSYSTSFTGNKYGIMEFHTEYILQDYTGDWVVDPVTYEWVWDPDAPVYYATSPWDYYPGPISGGLD